MLKKILPTGTDGLELQFSFHPMEDEIYRTLAHYTEYILCEGVDGDVGEFGVFTGRSAFVLAYGLRLFGVKFGARLEHLGQSNKMLRLFDSFEGAPEQLSEADAQSPSVLREIWRAGMLKLPYGTPEENARHSTHNAVEVLGADRVQAHIGYYSESLRNVPSSVRFSLVHIDCDFYDSVVPVLDFLFGDDRMTDGSVILFAGWNGNRASPNRGQRRAWRECCAKYPVEFSDQGAVGTLGRAFIIHKGEA